MTDSFKYLKDRRLISEENQRHQEEAEARALQQKLALARAALRLGHQYDPMVMHVLTQLQDAAYPRERARVETMTVEMYDQSHIAFIPPIAWSVGHEETHYRGDDIDRTWEWEVRVILICDQEGHPEGFECTRKLGYQQVTTQHCGLSEVELIAALQSLYP